MTRLTELPAVDGPAIHAAIDIGTNSMHLVVARADPDGGFDVLTTEKEMVRLGSGAGEMKRLAPDAIDRGIAALERMTEVAKSFGAVDLSAVATSAVREAENQQEFLDLAREVAGVEVEVISGFEEARLIHLGVLQALAVFDRRLLLIDIGGGSTELLVGKGETPLEARSMKLGAIRLTERFFTSDKEDAEVDTSPEAIEACRQYVRNALAPVARELSGHQPEIAIGSSGTIGTVATMVAAGRGETIRQLNGATFSAEELEGLVTRLEHSTQAERRGMSGLDEKRIDIIVGGVILLSEIFQALDVSELTVSEYALREGVLLDRFGGSTSAGLDRLVDLRRSNTERLAEQLDPDPDHAKHTAVLATGLFDRTVDLHGLSASERELLWSAAVLHNVGLFISHSSHHKHSYYVIRNSEQLTGFTQHEIELISVIARYHRKSHPSEKHAEFASLSDDDKDLVRLLAGMLRLAIGLDRRHAGAVRSVRVFSDEVNGNLTIEPVGDADADLDLEIYAATERSRLLSKALGVQVRVRPSHPVTSQHLSR